MFWSFDRRHKKVQNSEGKELRRSIFSGLRISVLPLEMVNTSVWVARQSASVLL